MTVVIRRRGSTYCDILCCVRKRADGAGWLSVSCINEIEEQFRVLYRMLCPIALKLAVK